ncbi:MAG: toxin-antitoxin system YwqK family antitoxin [Bacteroidales bacterium]|nr:toxin-antitoxin system YwqK family antitoxin [Bacteroidales bacterium]
MMQKKRLMIGGLLLLTVQIFAQVPLSDKDTLLNQVDKNGLKQGYWKKYYDNGNIKYEGYFKNDKPTGELKRYFENNVIQSILVFKENGKIAETKIFYQNGKLAAEGTYVDKIKDGVWKYYSYYGEFLSMEEVYSMGVKNGKSIKFYSDGQISESLNWTKGNKDGEWIQYFTNGKRKLYGTYKDGKLHGTFVIYYDTGIPNVAGNYLEDLRDGDWIIYDEKGKIELKIEYLKGIAKNQDELDRRETEKLNDLLKNKGKFEDPGKTGNIIR